MTIRLRCARQCVRVLSAVSVVLPAIAFATPQCTVSPGAALDFGSIPALASTGDVVSDTGASLSVSCTSDVTSPPSVYSATPRAMASGGRTLAFRLSLVSPGGPDLPTSAPGVPLAIARDGASHPVPLFGKIRAGDFRMLPAGHYTAPIVFTIEY